LALSRRLRFNASLTSGASTLAAASLTFVIPALALADWQFRARFMQPPPPAHHPPSRCSDSRASDMERSGRSPVILSIMRVSSRVRRFADIPRPTSWTRRDPCRSSCRSAQPRTKN
jgi:hypothetical protein